MAEIATECAVNLLKEGLVWLLKKVVAPVKVLICLPREITQMERDVENVMNDKYEIEEELRGEQQRAKPRVSTWLETAETLRVSSGSIREMYEAHQQHKSYLGCCPKCVCRYRISRDIRNWNRILAQLDSQRARTDFPSSGQYGDPTPRTQIPIPITQTGIVADAKRSEHRELAERWLTDENSNVQRIAIIGMGGVGKTSLLDAINNSEKVKTSFELIIKLTVSKNDMSSLQKCVAERLKLSLPDNPEVRRDMLLNRLKNRRYVLLLDDMWAADAWTSDKLQELGVSLHDTGYKILLTTREKEVCTKMNVQQTITMEPLPEEEGWQLFRGQAFQNSNGDVDPQIEEVAREIAKECKGLPLAITVVAAAMTQHTALYEWEVALNQMKSVPETFYDLHVGVDEKLNERLRWSYNVLPDRLKPCFLYFAAYPEDAVIEVSEVIDMLISEGLVEESGDSYLHDIGNSYIKQLVDRCLIELVSPGFGGRIFSVKMHDILRDLAIRIAEKEQRCFFKAGQSLESFNFEEVVSKDCVKLSLMSNDLQSLPTTFPFRSLSVLLLNKNRGIREVPESFLCELSSLKVLDLSKTGITSLPPSIRNLKHLASLQVQRTNISELPEAIGDLMELQFLDVSDCKQLLCLPERIGQLKRLRVLCLESCSKLTHLPRGIKKLISLEILTMRNTSIEWDFEKDANAEEASACSKDLQNFRRLRVFSANIKSPVKEGIMGNWSKMRELNLHFGRASYLPPDMHMMKDLENFALAFSDHVERMPHFPKLEKLYLFACDKLEELELGMGFPKLERLLLHALDSLECVGPVVTVGAASGSGGLGEGASPLPPMLKYVQVSRCPKLKRLRGRWDQLTHLESIEGSREWWDGIQFDDPNIKTLLQNKCRFW